LLTITSQDIESHSVKLEHRHYDLLLHIIFNDVLDHIIEYCIAICIKFIISINL